jgi:hypothetical protein
MSGNPEEGIQNLQEFCGLAAQANAQLQTDAANLDSFEKHLRELEGAMQEQWGGFSDQLREIDTTADTAGQQAEDTVTALATAAHDIADAKLVAGEEDLGDTETTLTDGLAQGRDDLQEGFDGLAQEGFEATQSTLDGVLSDLDADRSESDQAFDEADGALQEKEPELDAARAEADQDFAEAEAAADAEGTALEQAGEEGQSAWSESIAGELESGCQQVIDPLEAVYESFGEAARSDGDALMEAVGRRAETAAQLLGAEMTSSLEGAFGESVTGALEEWGTAVEAGLAVLREGQQVGTTLDPLMEELATSKDVIAQVDRLLEAMGGTA